MPLFNPRCIHTDTDNSLLLLLRQPVISLTCADLTCAAGASVEGGVEADDEVSTETPLQLAAAAGKLDIVELLLSFGASPFLSTLRVDTMSFGSSAQKGCYCALSTAASHGQRKAVHKLVTHPTTLTSQNSGKEVLSLEEILAEGIAGVKTSDREEDGRRAHKQLPPGNLFSRFSKNNVKKLQDSAV